MNHLISIFSEDFWIYISYTLSIQSSPCYHSPESLTSPPLTYLTSTCLVKRFSYTPYIALRELLTSTHILLHELQQCYFKNGSHGSYHLLYLSILSVVFKNISWLRPKYGIKLETASTQTKGMNINEYNPGSERYLLFSPCSSLSFVPF